MKAIFKVGDKKQHQKVVEAGDVAAFRGEVVHDVCSTFSLAREIEWTTRQFVLEMREDDEEGIGTHLMIEHKGPAFVGEEIIFTGKIESVKNHEVICAYEAHVGTRLIASGTTGQKIIKREKINQLLKRP